MIPTHEQACTWVLIDDDFNNWRSSCGEEWTLEDGTPTENKMRFCHYCGKPLKEAHDTDT